MPETELLALRERLRRLLDHLCDGLVERDDAARMLLLAALSGEHALLLGPPGTAKSALARRVHAAFFEAPYFERLLTRFTVPEELFGPLSIKALERDEFVRRTEGYLPRASVAFLDEIFKASSAILNALLTLLQEREFDNGSRRERTPLVCVVAASNELPQGDELDALYDRFLVRVRVEPVSEEGFDALLDAGDEFDAPAPEDRLSAEELEAIRRGARGVVVTGAVRGLLAELRGRLDRASVYVSDRRWRKIVRLLQTAAFTSGRSAVGIADCVLVEFCAWARIADQELVRKELVSLLRSALEAEPRRYVMLAEGLRKLGEEERSANEQVRDDEGHPLFEGDDGAPVRETHVAKPLTNEAGEALYYPPSTAGKPWLRVARTLTASQLWDEHFRGDLPGLQAYLAEQDHWVSKRVERRPVLRAKRYSEEQIAGRVAEVRALRDDLTALLGAAGELRGGGTGTLWVDAAYDDELRGLFESARTTLEPLVGELVRIEQLYRGLQRSEG